MTRRLNSEAGFALVESLLLLAVMIAISVGVAAQIDTQVRHSAVERIRESSFNQAEAALNAEAITLARSWPTTSGAPTSCDPSSVSTSCPQASSVAGGYTTKDYASACAGTANPAWKLTVRDNAAGEQYWTTAVDARGAYDGFSTADGVVWVRATGYAQCQKVSMVALVSHSAMAINFPNSVLTANWMQTSNQGKKVIIDTLGTYAQPASAQPGPAAQPSNIVLRCNTAPSPCANYASSKGQVQPPTVQTGASTSASALSLTQLQAVEQQAQSAGTYYGSSCPTGATLAALAAGSTVVIKGPCDISIGSNYVVNSGTKPGALIIENGTLSMSGTAYFYGLVYLANVQGVATSILNVTGNATIQGVTAIDGNGGATLGASKTNLIYDARAAGVLQGSTGAAINRNSFRLLPNYIA